MVKVKETLQEHEREANKTTFKEFSATSLLFYVGVEGEGSIDIMSKLSKKGLESPVRLEGDTPELGDFEIQIVEGKLA